ncbi:MAG TPA: LLM class flavin-dependent oxidoreductase [Casimicrobiaceae bacterium]|nr:LLM class flavin-dependent oxidoreductase [Casimicrobiaceae bacterium]
MSDQRGIGVCMLSTTPIQEFLKVARVADEVGLHSMWIAEGYHFFRDLGEPRSATTVAAAVALATRRIRIGLGIVPPFTRHPALLAMEAVSLSELSGGRFILGLGAAKAAAVHMDYGIDKLKPVPAHRDAIAIVRGLLKGEALDYRGPVFTFDAPPRRADEPAPSVPIAVGATGPLMLRLAGSLADIILLPTFTTPAFVAQARVEIDKGLRASGRRMEDVQIGATLPFSVHENSRVARDAIRRLTAVYIANKVQNIRNDTLMKAAGLGAEEAEPIARAKAEKGVEAATAMVTDEIMDKVVIAGNPDEVTAKLSALLRQGLTLPLLYQVIGPDRERAIRLVAETVKPAFEKA